VEFIEKGPVETYRAFGFSADFSDCRWKCVFARGFAKTGVQIVVFSVVEAYKIVVESWWKVYVK